jgi:hypothetical protein
VPRSSRRIHYFSEPQEFELYDLKADAEELHNLHGDPAHAPLSRQLAARLEELRHETGDQYAYQSTVLLKQEVTAGECEER